jgi:hypothetical protein
LAPRLTRWRRSIDLVTLKFEPGDGDQVVIDFPVEANRILEALRDYPDVAGDVENLLAEMQERLAAIGSPPAYVYAPLAPARCSTGRRAARDISHGARRWRPGHHGGNSAQRISSHCQLIIGR